MLTDPTVDRSAAKLLKTGLFSYLNSVFHQINFSVRSQRQYFSQTWDRTNPVPLRTRDDVWSINCIQIIQHYIPHQIFTHPNSHTTKTGHTQLHISLHTFHKYYSHQNQKQGTLSRHITVALLCQSSMIGTAQVSCLHR